MMVDQQPSSPVLGTPRRADVANGDSAEGLVFGQRSDGALVHISEVSSGLACDCVCPGCYTRLVARKGEQKEHHFGHYGVNSQPCKTGPETALHKFAKEVLGRSLRLALPPFEGGDHKSRGVNFRGGSYGFDSAALENKLSSIVPDVVVQRSARELIVEFRVTHPCDTAKIAKIRALNLAAIEIDLSGLSRDITRDGIENAILNEAPRRWLYNPKIGARHAAETQLQHEGERPLRQPQACFSRSYGAACKKLQSLQTPYLDYDRIVAHGLARAVGLEVPGFGCFRVPPRAWQAALLIDLTEVTGKHRVLTTQSALTRMEQRGWVDTRFSKLSNEAADGIRAAGIAFENPAGAIQAWAASAARLGVLLPDGGADRWVLWHGANEGYGGERR